MIRSCKFHQTRSIGLVSGLDFGQEKGAFNIIMTLNASFFFTNVTRSQLRLALQEYASSGLQELIVIDKLGYIIKFFSLAKG